MTMPKKRKEPRYLPLHRSGELVKRITNAQALLRPCRVCPHRCGVDRLAGELGLCRIGARARVASYGPHFGEETPLVGAHGSGTIFFEGCNLLCVFCQNYDISHIDKQGDQAAEAMTDQLLAAVMIELQDAGCHNINLVTPSHVVPQILAALPLAIEQGLHLPLVYNCGGYDTVEALALLDGVVDIYMPDCKFFAAEAAATYTRARDYPQIVQEALREMHRQVGELKVDERGLAVSGLLVRHLVMPGSLADTKAVLRFLAEEISRDTYVNIMDQYRPCGQASKYKELSRALLPDEYEQAMEMARELGLHRLDQRDWPRLLRRLLPQQG